MGVVAVVAQLVLNIQVEDDAAGHAKSQSHDVHGRVLPLAQQVAPGGGQVAAQHELVSLPYSYRSALTALASTSVVTRITVCDILEYLAGGMSEDEILEDFPALRREDIRAVLQFAAGRERRLSASSAG